MPAQPLTFAKPCADYSPRTANPARDGGACLLFKFSRAPREWIYAIIQIMKNNEGQVIFPPPGETPREDTASVMKFYKLPKSFPSAVLAEAARAKEKLKTPGKRLDLRKKFIFTCDPATARDYDDALSLETDRKGNRILGVHIADVSHFVTPDSAIDKEAYKRSTSVYFPDRVIPMLPESISNGVCSLVPHEDRLTFSVFMTFDAKGEMIARSFAKTIIRSRARFTYEQIMKVIAGGVAPELDARELKTIRAVAKLAMDLRRKRFAQGALDLEMPEAEVVLDDYGEMSGIVTRPYDESHQMIEECMVAANEAVATELWTKGVMLLARLHETPDPEKLQLLRAELRGLGIRLGNIENPQVFGQFMQSIKTNPLYPTLAMMVLRSMKKAVYDGATIGHYGLAKKYYAHFTSPIRRYPDLTLHRQLANYLTGGVQAARVSPRLLAKWAVHASEAEQRATEAERGLMEIKKYRLLEAEINARMTNTYDAVVVKCSPVGCFVELPDLAVSGLVHISTLSRKFVTFNEYDHSLRVPGGGSWHIGDRMKVRVGRVDFRQRRIDFLPCFARRSR